MASKFSFKFWRYIITLKQFTTNNITFINLLTYNKKCPLLHYEYVAQHINKLYIVRNNPNGLIHFASSGSSSHCPGKAWSPTESLSYLCIKLQTIYRRLYRNIYQHLLNNPLVTYLNNLAFQSFRHILQQ